MSALALTSNTISWAERPPRTRQNVIANWWDRFATDASSAALTMPFPLWIFDCDQRLTEISHLSPGWDGHGAREMNADAVAFARQLLIQIASPGLPAPHVAPLANGGIQLEWHAKGIDMEIEITDPYEISGLYEDHVTGEEADLNVVGSDLSSLNKPLFLLSNR